MESSRRQQAQADLGMDFAKEDQKREAALAKEQARADKKAAKREKMMNMPSYRLMVGTAKYMDKWFLDILMDVLIGAIPFYIGDVLDVFKRSYVENLKLITGYIEDDKEIINKVNKKAFWTAVFIVVLCWLIYVVISWAIRLGAMAYDWIVSLF